MQDLRQFIIFLENNHRNVNVEKPVSPILITEITDRVSKSQYEDIKAIFLGMI